MSERLLCVIEIPKGSRNKYELDHETGAIKLDRLLFSSVHYPTDYGFFPDTWALDDDPLDAMVCVSEPTFPGCQIEVKPIARLRMRDEKSIDDKVLCVPRTDPGWNSLEVLEDIPQGLRDEIGHFFSIYKNLERKQVEVDGWYSREDALAEIEASRTRFEERQKSTARSDLRSRDQVRRPDELSQTGGDASREGLTFIRRAKRKRSAPPMIPAAA